MVASRYVTFNDREMNVPTRPRDVGTDLIPWAHSAYIGGIDAYPNHPRPGEIPGGARHLASKASSRSASAIRAHGAGTTLLWLEEPSGIELGVTDLRQQAEHPVNGLWRLRGNV
jgi:hypothetical protein